MKLLAIDTSTDACSAALYLDGDISERFAVAPREHAALILPMIDELFAEAALTPAQLDALAFGRGPGSFTGVRIATGVIQGFAFGAGLPVVPVSSLAALACGACRRHGVSRVLAAFDARMGELYWGSYQLEVPDGLRQARYDDTVLLGAERVCRPEQIPHPGAGDWFGAGSGWAAYGEILGRQLKGAVTGTDPGLLPHAGDVALLAAGDYARGLAVAAADALPVYLRDNVASPKG